MDYAVCVCVSVYSDADRCFRMLMMLTDAFGKTFVNLRVLAHVCFLCECLCVLFVAHFWGLALHVD